MPLRPKSHAQRMREQQPRKPEDRPSSYRRGYDDVWRRFRTMVLNERPMCQEPGCNRPSTDVDHIIALERGGARLDDANVQALCHSHHSQKTARTDGGFGRVSALGKRNHTRRGPPSPPGAV